MLFVDHCSPRNISSLYLAGVTIWELPLFAGCTLVPLRVQSYLSPLLQSREEDTCRLSTPGVSLYILHLARQQPNIARKLTCGPKKHRLSAAEVRRTTAPTQTGSAHCSGRPVGLVAVQNAGTWSWRASHWRANLLSSRGIMDYVEFPYPHSYPQCASFNRAAPTGRGSPLLWVPSANGFAKKRDPLTGDGFAKLWVGWMAGLSRELALGFGGFNPGGW